jgi:hypothetical protein
MTNSADADSTSEANIAQDKEHHRQLGLQFFWGDETDKAKEKKGTKNKKKEKDAARTGTR